MPHPAGHCPHTEAYQSDSPRTWFSGGITKGTIFFGSRSQPQKSAAKAVAPPNFRNPLRSIIVASSLDVAGPAVDGDAPAAVAREAPSHAELLALDGDAVLVDPRVAGKTRDLPVGDHPEVGEVGVLLQFGHPEPGDRSLLLPVLRQFPDLRAVGGDHPVAHHAFLYGRDPRGRGPRGVDVAEPAVEPVIGHVDLVAVPDRLLGGGGGG